MKIVNRKDFMEFPRGTLFCEYDPEIFGELLIKGDTIVHDGVNADWQYQEIQNSIKGCCSKRSDILDEAEVKGTSFELDLHALSRDGCYDDDQMYCIWEEKDVEGLIQRLNETLIDSFTQAINRARGGPPPENMRGFA